MSMMFHPRRRPLAAAVLLAAGVFGALAARADDPPVQLSHGTEYMSGGIGSDEARLMAQASARWPATLEFAVRDEGNRQGAVFAANVRVQVHDASGQTVLDTVSEGPFLLARLAPGRYDVEASFNGQPLKQQLTVGKGVPGRKLFVWPASAMRS